MSECIAGQAYTFRISVFDSADGRVAKNNPTINAADFLISINDGAETPLTNTPTVISGGRVIRVILSAAETTAAGANGSIVLKVADASASDGWIGGDVEIKVRAYATATSADVTTITSAITAAQGVITAAITAAQGVMTSAITTTQGIITTAIAALNNLSASQVWTYMHRSLTGTAAQQTAPVVGSTLNITRSATYTVTLTGIAVPDGWTSARWTVKVAGRNANPDSTTALIQVLVSATPNAATDGLVVLNGETAELTLTDASLLISGTNATITIADHITARLGKGAYEYDIKFFYGSSASTVVTKAQCNVVLTPTQTV